MPLIRYELDDSAEPVFDKHRITGHRDGIVFGKNNERISAAALNIHSEKLNALASYQLQQKKKGELIVRMIPLHKLTKGEIAEIRTVFQNQAGNGLDVRIEIVDEMILTQRGKYILLIQELSNI